MSSDHYPVNRLGSTWSSTNTPVRKWIWILFSFKGRFKRFTFIVVNVFVFFVFAPIVYSIWKYSGYDMIIVPPGIAMIWISLASQFKRFQDLGIPGATALLFNLVCKLLNLLPPLGGVLMLVGWIWLAARKGESGDNKYGPDPYKV